MCCNFVDIVLIWISILFLRFALVGGAQCQILMKWYCIMQLGVKKCNLKTKTTTTTSKITFWKLLTFFSLSFCFQEMELILRAANISTTLPEPDLSSSSSPQLTHLLMGNQTQAPSQTQTMHTMQPRSSSVPGSNTLHHLLKTQHGHNNNETMSNSVDSPRHMDLVVNSIDEDDCILMEGDGD